MIKVLPGIKKIKIAAIYQIVNTKTGDNYIGSSHNINERFWQHLWDLRRNKHFNPALQKHYNKYGEEVFRFEILQLLTNSKKYIMAEHKYSDAKIIKEKQPTYNVFIGGKRK